ncbi:hypothetical protein Pcinc_035527 [Petrolisthes cinctipes]|uniref:Uncharacterized protein n=1 Tax=Petrolisthes cinctipes TaxID=88211 RepID=A0AAE1EPD2_PETCI|nr:hypothetical protein Pcinc_035527 [Petrolisthes cinctipes]
MCTLLNIRDSKYCKYVENRISGNDLVSFVCENKEDMNSFKLTMDRQCIRVNLVNSVPAPPDRYQPDVPLENIRRLGFHTYMRVCRRPTCHLDIFVS